MLTGKNLFQGYSLFNINDIPKAIIKAVNDLPNKLNNYDKDIGNLIQVY